MPLPYTYKSATIVRKCMHHVHANMSRIVLQPSELWRSACFGLLVHCLHSPVATASSEQVRFIAFQRTIRLSCSSVFVPLNSVNGIEPVFAEASEYARDLRLLQPWNRKLQARLDPSVAIKMSGSSVVYRLPLAMLGTSPILSRKGVLHNSKTSRCSARRCQCQELRSRATLLHVVLKWRARAPKSLLQILRLTHA